MIGRVLNKSIIYGGKLSKNLKFKTIKIKGVFWALHIVTLHIFLAVLSFKKETYM